MQVVMYITKERQVNKCGTRYSPFKNEPSYLFGSYIIIIY
nr:MAG TPA: hypothetical protein [Caudoviricetes sp.]